MRRCRAVALLGALFACGAGAADRGVYIGAGVGQATIEEGAVNFDARSTSYREFIGYRAPVARLLELAAEASYIDWGNASQNVAGVTRQYHLNGGELAALAIVPLGPLDFYGRAGVVSWSSSKNVGGMSSSQSGTSGLYGLGLGFRVSKLALRAEYDRYNVSAVDRLQTYRLSWVLRFY